MRTQLAATASILSSFAVCCVDAAPPEAPPPASIVAPPVAHHPASCLDAGGDGSVTLFLGGDARKPWQAFCHHGGAYVELHADAPDANVASYAAGGDAVGTTVRTQYRRIRIDPETLTVDISDQTFATSSGALQVGADTITAMPFGVAAACGGDDLAVANIDLGDTPFVVAMRFASRGPGAFGDVTPRDGGHAIDLTAAGTCGQTGPAGLPARAHHLASGGWFLQLAYVQAF